MHDPMTVAFEIESPIKRKSKLFPNGYRKTWITIWHVDPETDHTDDSCGWFIRPRHCDQKKLALIEKRFEEDFDRTWKSDSGHVYNCGLFYPVPNGHPHLSVMGIALNLFMIACNVHFSCDGITNWKKSKKWMRSHLFDVLHFAENPTDSLYDGFTRKFEDGCGESYTERIRKDRIHALAGCIYSYILRTERPWYKHPRWHFWHWKIQVHGVQNFKRWLFSRCAYCGKRFHYGESPVSHQWGSDGPQWFRGERAVYHGKCSEKQIDQTAKPTVYQPNFQLNT